MSATRFFIMALLGGAMSVAATIWFLNTGWAIARDLILWLVQAG